MADHSDFLELAREMLEEEGRLVTFAKLDPTAADANKPWRGPAAPTLTGNVDAFAVFLPHTGETEFGRMITDSELFKKCEQVLLVAPPTTGEYLGDYHIVVDDSVRWRIEIARELKPADLTVLYAMGVCR